MDRAKQLRTTGLVTFFFSGVCAISTGVIVSLLQEMYGFSYSVTGTLLALMNVGSMAASFASGILPGKIGTRTTVAVLCAGYAVGYVLMGATGAVWALMLAFSLVGVAKGCVINNCTVLVGNNSPDRTRGLSLMHACYACGALLCPFVAAWMGRISPKMPMFALAALGLLLWGIFMAARLPDRESAAKEKTKMDFLRSKRFWLLVGLLFCQNAAETSVTGWMVTYYRDQQILSGGLSTYTVTIMWGATLMGRLLIAFVFPVKNTFRALSIMGVGCTVLYAAMMFSQTPVMAVVMLFAFAFAMAGVNPVTVAGIGRSMNAASVGVLLPVASFGAILMPWVTGFVADFISLQAGMLCNLIPCVGIPVLSVIIRKMDEA